MTRVQAAAIFQAMGCTYSTGRRSDGTFATHEYVITANDVRERLHNGHFTWSSWSCDFAINPETGKVYAYQKTQAERAA